VKSTTTLFVPYYQQLGVIIPDNLKYQPGYLQSIADEILEKLKQLKIIAYRNHSMHTNDVNRLMKLRTEFYELFQQLKIEVEDHYSEEERFWPDVMRPLGKVSFLQILE
jgi:hypothetical protein